MKRILNTLVLLFLAIVSATPLSAQDNKVYEIVEHMPEFPGGEQALMQFLSENIKYPVDAEEKGIQGRVILSFIVEKNGGITNPTVVKSVSPSIDQEAVRVISAMPRWKQGTIGIHPVRVKYSIPITFRLGDDSKKTEKSATSASPVNGSSQTARSVASSSPTDSSNKPSSATRKHMKFLGLELGGNAKALEKALRAKGFKDGDGFDESGNSIFLKGMVYGQMSSVSIDATGGRANSVNVVNLIDSEAKAKQRWNLLKQKMIAEYGQGYEPWENHYEISLTYGSANCEYGAFDSGDIELVMSITDYEKVLDRPDYNVSVYGIACQFLDDYNNWNSVRTVLKENGYTVVGTPTSTTIKARRHFMQFDSNVTVTRASANASKVKDVLITTTNSMASVEELFKFNDFKPAGETARGGKLYKMDNLTMEIFREGDVICLHLSK